MTVLDHEPARARIHPTLSGKTVRSSFVISNKGSISYDDGGSLCDIVSGNTVLVTKKYTISNVRS
jgi:hypothetical protein